MNKYISSIGNGEYVIQFCTDNEDNYDVVQDVICLCKDGKNIREEVEKKKQELYERDVPKKVVIGYDMGVACESCPICYGRSIRNGYCTRRIENGIRIGAPFKYCPDCGQRLDWSDIEEEE